MNSIEKNLKDYELLMTCEDTSKYLKCYLPEGYDFKNYYEYKYYLEDDKIRLERIK